MTSNGTQQLNEESAESSNGARGDGEHRADAQAMDASAAEKPVDTTPSDEPASASPAQASSTEAASTAAPSADAPSADASEGALAAEAATPRETPSSAEASSPVVTQDEVVVPEEVPAEPASASVRPVFESAPTSVSSVAPAIELSDDFAPRSIFWSTRPSRSWMLVGGSAIVIAFFTGALTSRAVQPDPAPEFVAPASPPASDRPPTVAAPAMAPAAPLPTSNAAPSTVVAPAKRAQPAFNTKAAKAAIDGIAPRVKACKHAGDPSGPASVMVTFAPAGSVSDASVATPGYAGTRTESCIVQRLRDIRIPEFTGAAVTVKRSVTVR